MKQLTSPAAGIAWRCLMLSLASLVPAVLLLSLHLDLDLMPAAAVQVVVGLLTATSWILVVRFLLLDTWGRWFWRVVVVGAGILVLTQGETGLGFAIALSVLMLTLRRYRPWRLISDRRRAAGFGLGLVTLVLLVLVQRLWSVAGDSSVGLIGRNLGTWSVWSLLSFWIMSLFHLAIKMRLHFLRLRPKLAVSAFLIGVLPLLLMVVLGVMVLYTTMGGARAARLNNIMASWRDITAQGGDLSGALFDTTFVWPAGEVDAGPGVTVLPTPAWAPELGAGMRRLVANERRVARVGAGVRSAVKPDTTNYFLAGGKLWLMR